MGKIIKAEKRGGGWGIESKVIEEYTPLMCIYPYVMIINQSQL